MQLQVAAPQLPTQRIATARRRVARQHAHWQTSAETQHARYGGYNDVGAT